MERRLNVNLGTENIFSVNYSYDISEVRCFQGPYKRNCFPLIIVSDIFLAKLSLLLNSAIYWNNNV